MGSSNICLFLGRELERLALSRRRRGVRPSGDSPLHACHQPWAKSGPPVTLSDFDGLRYILPYITLYLAGGRAKWFALPCSVWLFRPGGPHRSIIDRR